MTIAIKPFTEQYIPTVKEFNSRLTAAGVPFDLRFPEFCVSDWLPKIGQRRLYQEDFILLEDGIMRGGYRLKRQDFSIRGQILPIDCFHWPMSEAVINRAYSWIFSYMLRHAQKSRTFLYSLGMAGSADTLIPRMLKAAGWKVRTLPFLFKINHARRFLREIQPLRKSGLSRCLLGGAAWTGIGRLAIRTAQRVRTRGNGAGVETERVREFGGWADDLWNRCKDQYAMIAVRDSESLNILYRGERFLSYKICRNNKVLGWAILLDTRMWNNKYFGNMRVGTVLDCLAQPDDTAAVIRGAAGVLEQSGVDLIVSNQSQADWCSAFRKAGFFSGPSNFSFAASRDLSNVLAPFEFIAPQVHMTRGDGEGPLHL